MKVLYLFTTDIFPSLIPLINNAASNSAGDEKLGWQELVVLVALGGMYFFMMLLLLKTYLSMDSENGNKKSQASKKDRVEEKGDDSRGRQALQKKSVTEVNDEKTNSSNREKINLLCLMIILPIIITSAVSWIMPILKEWLNFS